MGKQPLAYHMADFLEGDDGRPIRILAEYLEPLRRFRAHNIQDTVVLFGSARFRDRDWADRALARLERHGEDVAAHALDRARRAVRSSRYYEEARELAYLLTRWSLTLGSPRHRFVVCSGGGPGLMEAANRGAHEAGGKTIGLNIRLPFEQGANRYITEGLRFEFRYFFMRKFWFAYLAKALIVFPGGFGTLDELFEFLTLAQTEKLAQRIAVLLYGRTYWDQVLHFSPMAEWGAIGRDELDLIRYADSPQEAFEYLRDHLTTHHLVPATPEEDQAPAIARTRK